jgi:N-acetylglucosamine malate deacetylase 1
MLTPEKVLVIAPHTDDETLGCGGLVSRLAKQGADITLVALSTCGREDLTAEFRDACKRLAPIGYPTTEDFKVRQFDRQGVLDRLIEYRQALRPDLVLCPASFDVHQDHHCVYQEAVRAFKGVATILGYCHEWNVVGTCELRLTVKLSKANLVAKSRAMDCYKSQKDRPYFKNRIWLGDEKYEVIQWIV